MCFLYKENPLYFLKLGSVHLGSLNCFFISFSQFEDIVNLLFQKVGRSMEPKNFSVVQEQSWKTTLASMWRQCRREKELLWHKTFFVNVFCICFVWIHVARLCQSSLFNLSFPFESQAVFFSPGILMVNFIATKLYLLPLCKLWILLWNYLKKDVIQQ